MGNGFLWLIIVLICTALFAFGVWVDSRICDVKWGQSGMSVKYELVAGCMVKGKGGWVPAGSYREMP